MAWRRIGDKPLPELMLTRFIDAYMKHSGGGGGGGGEGGILINWSLLIKVTPMVYFLLQRKF